MILYHGSTVEVSIPKIITSELGRDFGSAFYTTDIKEQAERWARRRAMINRKRGLEGIAIVNKYEWSRDISSLMIKEFRGASSEWLEMVVKCRSTPGYKHNYDIVMGKIANDNVGETVTYVIQGIMRKEDAIERLKFEKINNQIAFCTNKALSELRYCGHYECEVMT